MSKKEKDRKRIKTKYIEELYQDHKYSIEKFDSQALFISSGALGLSLSFIENLVPLATAKYQWIFILSIWLFVISISIGFIAHYKYSRIIMNQIKLVDEDRLHEIKPDKFTPVINRLLTSVIIFGILTLVLFVSINILST